MKVGQKVRVTLDCNGVKMTVEGTVRVVLPNGSVFGGTEYLGNVDSDVWEVLEPAEPQNIGAVVRGDDGKTYVRVGAAGEDFSWVDAWADVYNWSDLGDVEVLSEGVEL